MFFFFLSNKMGECYFGCHEQTFGKTARVFSVITVLLSCYYYRVITMLAVCIIIFYFLITVHRPRPSKTDNATFSNSLWSSRVHCAASVLCVCPPRIRNRCESQISLDPSPLPPSPSSTPTHPARPHARAYSHTHKQQILAGAPYTPSTLPSPTNTRTHSVVVIGLEVESKQQLHKHWHEEMKRLNGQLQLIPKPGKNLMFCSSFFFFRYFLIINLKLLFFLQCCSVCIVQLVWLFTLRCKLYWS